jgi:alpha-beta hydrolase superfamily lysophospholipase
MSAFHVILVPGLTASNSVFANLEQRLLDEGFSVTNVKLPKHDMVHQLLDLTFADIETAVKKAAAPHTSLVYIGESFGGNVVCHCADERVRGMVLIGTAFAHRSKRHEWWAIPLLARFYPRMAYIKEPSPDIETNRRFSVMPIRTIHLYRSHRKKLRRDGLKTRHLPLLFLFSKGDEVMHVPKTLRFLKKRGNVTVRSYEFPKHSFISIAPDTIFDELVNFLRTLESAA